MKPSLGAEDTYRPGGAVAPALAMDKRVRPVTFVAQQRIGDLTAGLPFPKPVRGPVIPGGTVLRRAAGVPTWPKRGGADMADREDLEQFRERAAAWLATQREHAPRDYGAILPPDLAPAARAWQARIFDAGFAGIHWPEEHGGRGLTPEHNAAWIVECALAQVPPLLNMVGCVLTGGALLAFGTEEQKATHLRPILTGERVWCQLFSEPDAGSDLAGLCTAAVRDGDDFVVNGQKVWCSNGRVADWGILMARTNREAPPHEGISFLLLDMASAGVQIRPLEQMNAEAEFDEVFLTDVRVPAANLLGPQDEGWMVGMSALTNERGYIGASGISLKRRLDAMLALGGSLGPLERQELVRLWSRGTALWAMGRQQGPVASVLGSVAKLGTTELMWDFAVFRAGLEGARGMLASDATTTLLSAPGARIAGGTSQIQRNIIGERILGLPKEPKATGNQRAEGDREPASRRRPGTSEPKATGNQRAEGDREPASRRRPGGGEAAAGTL
jgi:alkylation response protein AidB-like acyl-CoA dehydrogenase